ncbi:MAG: hypothetical protein IMF19_04625 [Proteobacteria bacterium]|nr:hypothetical protein [Pseudomonadota bacterium]
MKKLIIICLLFALTACAHNKPIATPVEVNNYLDRIAERSNIDPISG